MRKIFNLIMATFCILPSFSGVVSADSSPSSPVPSVIITEVKLGGDSFSQGTDQPKDPQEYITLYNQSGSSVSLDGWVLEYAKSSFDKSHCSDGSWLAHSISGSVSQTTLSGILQPGQVSTPIARPLTDNTAGSLHLVNAADKNNLSIEDLVGWGTIAPCYETSATSTPSNGKSIKRFLNCNNLPIDSSDNSKDFATNQPPSPGLLGNPYQTDCQDNSSGSASDILPTAPTCEGILLTELLPNPAGTDTGHEFIELYNPTASAISLQGCSLQTTASSKVFNFAGTVLQPGEYHAFYDSETGLTLPNAAGGTAWLLSPSTELQAITYPGNLDDNVTWALFSGSWQATYQPSPNAANVLVALKPCASGQTRNASTGYCDSNTATTATSSTLTPCQPGQERNPATNRCRAVTTAASILTPCKPGQERNPDTNRCHSASSTSSTLTACKSGQERNPATNRCKAVATLASATLKPCAAGQQRNPATNRCRKASTAGAIGKISNAKDAVAGSLSSSPHWWLAGSAVVGATGYGVYEWRQEFSDYLRKITSRSRRSQA